MEAAVAVRIDMDDVPGDGSGLVVLGLQPSRATSPERALALTVLTETLRDAVYSTNDEIRIEAQAWIAAPESKWPFNFVTLCEAFGLEPGAVRTQIRLLLAGQRRAALRVPRSAGKGIRTRMQAD